jgi:hypothetical protein
LAWFGISDEIFLLWTCEGDLETSSSNAARVSGDDLLRLTARERSTTLWLVCSVIRCAIRRARPPVLQGLARSIILHQRAKRKQLLHRDVTVVDSFSRFGSETYCKGVSTVLVSTDDHSVSYPSNSDSHSWHSSCCPGI